MRIRRARENERSTNFLKFSRRGNTLHGSSSTDPFNENKRVENCARKRVGARMGRSIRKITSDLFDSIDERRNWKVQISRKSLNKRDEAMKEMQKKKNGIRNASEKACNRVGHFSRRQRNRKSQPKIVCRRKIIHFSICIFIISTFFLSHPCLKIAQR